MNCCIYQRTQCRNAGCASVTLINRFKVIDIRRRDRLCAPRVGKSLQPVQIPSGRYRQAARPECLITLMAAGPERERCKAQYPSSQAVLMVISRRPAVHARMIRADIFACAASEAVVLGKPARSCSGATRHRYRHRWRGQARRRAAYRLDAIGARSAAPCRPTARTDASAAKMGGARAAAQRLFALLFLPAAGAQNGVETDFSPASSPSFSAR